MKKNLSAITIGLCFLFACSNPDNSTDTATETPLDSSAANTATAGIDANVQSQATDNNSGALAAPGTITTTSPQAATPTAAGMNPAHGEPGHRCEIAVGAPLNSAPAIKDAASKVTMTSPSSAVPAITPVTSPAPAPVTISTSPATPAATATPATTAPGMNPPHGEPGHDCKIAVGAPLKK